MKSKKLLIFIVLILSLAITNIFLEAPVSAAPSHSTTSREKVSGYIYKGTLKTKSTRYGIEIINNNGTKKFVIFDTKGQKLAKNLVSAAKLKDGAAISVNGIIINNVVQVISISQLAAKEETFQGWLGDSDCSPNIEDPKAMGTACLKCQQCEASGYGISIKQKDGTNKYYKFDAKGHKLAREEIIPKTTSKKVPEITVKGTLAGDIIKVSSIILK